jgi:hypothetical protein
MAKCSEMKVGQVYVCRNCGFELKVLKECTCGQDCSCEPLTCCDRPMTLRQG